MSQRSSHALLSPALLRGALLGGVLALGAALAGCAQQQQEIAACPVAPPPTREEIPKPPVSEHMQIWQPGHWDWNGAAYTWRPGAWVPRQGQSNQWMDGYWSRSTVPGPCSWTPAHWL
jgi:hypothetical protein